MWAMVRVALATAAKGKCRGHLNLRERERMSVSWTLLYLRSPCWCISAQRSCWGISADPLPQQGPLTPILPLCVTYTFPGALLTATPLSPVPPSF